MAPVQVTSTWSVGRCGSAEHGRQMTKVKAANMFSLMDGNGLALTKFEPTLPPICTTAGPADPIAVDNVRSLAWFKKRMTRASAGRSMVMVEPGTTPMLPVLAGCTLMSEVLPGTPSMKPKPVGRCWYQSTKTNGCAMPSRVTTSEPRCGPVVPVVAPSFQSAVSEASVATVVPSSNIQRRNFTPTGNEPETPPPGTTIDPAVQVHVQS